MSSCYFTSSSRLPYTSLKLGQLHNIIPSAPYTAKNLSAAVVCNNFRLCNAYLNSAPKASSQRAFWMGGDITVSWLCSQNHKKVEMVDSEWIVGFKVLIQGKHSGWAISQPFLKKKIRQCTADRLNDTPFKSKTSQID